MTPLLLALALVAPQAAAPLTPESSDARCVVVLGFIGAQPNQPAEKITAIKAGTMYFIGKMRGRNPAINLPATLTRAGQQAEAAKVNVGQEAKRCGDELTAIGTLTAAQAKAAPRK